MSWFTNRTQEIRDAEKRERNDITRAKRQLAAGEISREEYDTARSQIAQKKASGNYVAEAASTTLADNKNKLNNTGSENKEPTNTKAADTEAPNNTADSNENTAQKASTNVGKIASAIQSISVPAAFYNARPGVDPTGMSTAKREQASIHDKQAGDEQRNMQANQQIANRNYRSEADRNAASTAAAMNAQNVANLAAGAGAGAAALQRQVVTPEYNVTMNRSDTQRKEGVTNQREMYGAQNVAADERGTANKWDYDARQRNIINSLTSGLSNGWYRQGEENSGATQSQQNDTPVDTPTDMSTNTDVTADTPTPTQENPVAVDEATDVTDENTVSIDGRAYDAVDLQNAMNELEMRNDPSITKRYVYGITDNKISVNSDIYRNDVNNRRSRAEWLAKYLWDKYNGDMNAIRDYNGKIRSVWTNGHSNYENDTDRATTAAKDTTTQA